MKKVILIISYVIIVTSCNDNTREPIDNLDNHITEIQKEKENEQSCCKDYIYMEQTDHIAMLTKLVWFDKASSKYILALSKEDAYKMGFTINECLFIENYVKTLNQVNLLYK